MHFLTWTLSYKVKDDLAVNSGVIKCFCVEVFNKNSKSIVLDLTYQPPNGDSNERKNHFKNIFSKWEITNKELVLVGDFILISLTLMKAKWFKVLWISCFDMAWLPPYIKQHTYYNLSYHIKLSNKCWIHIQTKLLG